MLAAITGNRRQAAAVRTVTRTTAEAVGLDDRGEIGEGMQT